jgi:hypothetical protein
MFSPAQQFGMMPMPGGGGVAGPAAQGLTPQQLAMLTANQSMRGPRTIAPPYLARMTGQPEAPGLASSQDLSLAALYGLGGGQG